MRLWQLASLDAHLNISNQPWHFLVLPQTVDYLYQHPRAKSDVMIYIVPQSQTSGDVQIQLDLSNGPLELSTWRRIRIHFLERITTSWFQYFI